MLYSENPNLGKKTVLTSGGNTEYLCNCRYIKGEYHATGIDCHLVDGQWYRVKSGLIEFDHEKKVWMLTSEIGNKCIKGIVGFNEAGVETMGIFQKTLIKTPCFS